MGVDLSISLGGARVSSPVTTASGCFGAGKEMSRFVDLTTLGAVVCKTVTPNPRLGISPTRGTETASGMLNAIGLQNPGVEHFRDEDVAWLYERGIPVIPSIGGHSVEDYVACAEALRDTPGVVALEMNLSCPNLEDRGFMFALSAERTAEVTRAVKEVSSVPVFTKLSPDVTDLRAIATAAVESGADGLSLINTTLGMAIDVETRRPKLSTGTGGLSGPAIKPIAVRCVYQVHSALPHVPIIGMGGVQSVEDAVEFILAGATAVAIGTANFYDPTAAERIARGLAQWCDARGIATLDEIRGTVKLEG
ncbi:MAG TPA: dihydroorotate dehydrogenase [Actinomycetota bacterium]|nr:dihydroorotate dehydrogenase [Actinomycetota bacterium]